MRYFKLLLLAFFFAPVVSFACETPSISSSYDATTVYASSLSNVDINIHQDGGVCGTPDSATLEIRDGSENLIYTMDSSFYTSFAAGDYGASFDISGLGLAFSPEVYYFKLTLYLESEEIFSTGTSFFEIIDDTPPPDEDSCGLTPETACYFHTSSTTPLYTQDSGNLSLALTIIIVILFILVSAFIFNKMTSKKPWL